MDADWRRVINLEGSQKLGLPFSTALIVGQLVFVSGQASYDALSGEIIRGTFEDEARRAFDNLKQALEAAGSGLQYVIKLNAYISDIDSDLVSYNQLYRDYFVPPFPARTTVGVDLGGFKLEIDAIAYLARNAEATS